MCRRNGRRKHFSHISFNSKSDDYCRIGKDQVLYNFPRGKMKSSSVSTSENILENICLNTNPKKLLECNDIESNPGPTQNEVRSSGGRKRKRGFQNKLGSENSKDSAILFSNEVTLPKII